MSEVSLSSHSDFDRFAMDYCYWEHTCSRQRYHEIEAYIPLVAPDNILDIGCGAGSLLLRLSQKANSAIGLDISLDLLKMAQAKSREVSANKIRYILGDVRSLPLASQSFDFIVSYGVLHHTDLSQSLTKLKYLLKPEGRLVIYDYVSSNRALNSSLIWQIWRALRSAPGYWKYYGIDAAWRIVSFRISPKWLYHVCHDNLLSPKEFTDICQSLLPNCRVEHYKWSMAAFWEAPPDLNITMQE